MISDTRMWYGSLGLAPRQVAAVAAVPGEQPLPEAAPIRRRRQARLACVRRLVATYWFSAISYNFADVKIYTRTGDSGETSLFGGTRVPKHDPRVDAYGEVDELNAWLGFVRASRLDADTRRPLVQIQRDLFALGAQLADPVGRGRRARLESGPRRRATSSGSKR